MVSVMLPDSSSIPRADLPDPLRARSHWRSLNGQWDFCRDTTDMLVRSRRMLHEIPPHPAYDETILVPFPPHSELSGVGMVGHYSVLWYRRSFLLTKTERAGHVILCLGAVDFSCDIWINGQHAGFHRGGYTPVKVDITHLADAENVVELRVEDHLKREQPRGKQSWQAPFACWYRECSGIWQPVWLEFAPLNGLRELSCTAHTVSTSTDTKHDGRIDIMLMPFQTETVACTLAILREGQRIQERTVVLGYPATSVSIDLSDIELWDLDHPALYDVVADVVTAEGLHSLSTYVGFRTIGCTDTHLTINGLPAYQRLILDQGFWPKGTYTAPDDNAFRLDIEAAQAMGFNGCRKHAKIEDPRFYYWADRLGFLVWEELPLPYEFTPAACTQVEHDTTEMIRRDKGHPSVVAWTLYNESWGISDIRASRSQQEQVGRLTALVRQLDPGRLVVSNDGWEHVDGDLYGIHSYARDGEQLRTDIESAYGGLERKRWVSDDCQIPGHNKPLSARSGLPADRLRMLTEFGGIGFTADASSEGWGYEGLATTVDELLHRFKDLVQTAKNSSSIGGFVYTQLTDVEQEVNGLLTADRRFKLPVDKIRSIVRNDR